jgi:hypothetical protein
MNFIYTTKLHLRGADGRGEKLSKPHIVHQTDHR